MVLQPNLLEFGLCKFNVIINIINITFRSDVVERYNIFKF
jgi:hypothetical protein